MKQTAVSIYGTAAPRIISSFDRNLFFSGDGLVKQGVEKTIETVGRLARFGMKETDEEIIRLMMEE